MIKRTVIILAILGLTVLTTHCTSTDSKSEEEADVVASDDPNAAPAEGVTEGTPPEGDIAATDSAAGTTDTLPEEAVGDIAATPSGDPALANNGAAGSEADLALPPDAGAGDPALATSDPGVAAAGGGDLSLPPDGGGAPAQASTPPETANTATNTSASPSMGSTGSDLGGSPTTTDVAMNSNPTGSAMDSAPPLPDSGGSSSPSSGAGGGSGPGLQKVASTPWKVGKKWANAVYFAHPNDTLESIAEKIYGSGASVNLAKMNPQYASRSLKPGDKVYYNSPQRPDDQEKVLTYYEDNNIEAMSYTSQAGDTIRKVAKKLVGYDGAWKELWASNDVESKGELPEGTTLRYWPYTGDATPTPTKVAEASPPPAESPAAPAPAPPPEPPAAAPPQADAMPPAPPQMAEGGTVPPPPGAGAEVPPPPSPEAPPPPPPPGGEVAAPTAPAGDSHEGGATAGEHGPEGEEDPMVYGVMGLAALAIVALIMIRKKRKQKELEQALNETQVG